MNASAQIAEIKREVSALKAAQDPGQVSLLKFYQFVQIDVTMNAGARGVIRTTFDPAVPNTFASVIIFETGDLQIGVGSFFRELIAADGRQSAVVSVSNPQQSGTYTATIHAIWMSNFTGTAGIGWA